MGHRGEDLAPSGRDRIAHCVDEQGALASTPFGPSRASGLGGNDTLLNEFVAGYVDGVRAEG